MKHLSRLFVFLVFLAADQEASAAPIIREAGAIYLSDFGQKPLKVKILRPAPCYFDIGMTRYAGTLRFPQIVQIEAVTESACRIRGNAQQGGVAAWIPFNELEPLPPDLVANLRKSEERRQVVEALIAKNEVAIGMTMAEVGRSLGKPQKTTKRADKDGTQQVWEFVKYDLVPQTTYAPGYSQTVVNIPGSGKKPGGTIVQGVSGYYPSTIYVKVPVGTLTVTFKDGIVDTLDQSEGTLVGAGQVSIVTPPINVYW
ncbi:MAG TPA: hypothetical protein PLS03_07855 [Terrimicrobiaceae bacterium]|nr:hypothetical protein [Terrimicrobiaceae bacterium]